MNSRLLFIVATLALTACASAPRYACGVPNKTGGCRTVSKVFDDSVAMTATPATAAQPSPIPAPAALAVPSSGDPLLSRPRVVRVLVLPWEDEDGDLHAGGYLYLRLDRGAWTLTP